MQYQDLYNIPQTAFEDAIKEKEVELEPEVEDEREQEYNEEMQTNGEYVAANYSDSEDDIADDLNEVIIVELIIIIN